MYISIAIDCSYTWMILIRNINASTRTVRGFEDLSCTEEEFSGPWELMLMP